METPPLNINGHCERNPTRMFQDHSNFLLLLLLDSVLHAVHLSYVPIVLPNEPKDLFQL